LVPLSPNLNIGGLRNWLLQNFKIGLLIREIYSPNALSGVEILSASSLYTSVTDVDDDVGLLTDGAGAC